MPATCGLACEVCKFKERCGGGCVPGTDPRAPKRVEQLDKLFAFDCPVLRCAIENKVEYCLNCENFPCDVHYQESPYSKKWLDSLKELSKEDK